MSSNNNSNDNGAASGFVLVIAGLAFIGMFIFAVLAFLACILTFLAFLAWNKPLKLGRIRIEPEEARGFVQRGFIGAILAPVFVAFCSGFFNIAINWDFLPHMICAGYVAGSIGLEILLADDEANVVPALRDVSPDPQRPTLTQQHPLPRPEPTPFRFASWDDEEEQK